VSDPVNHPAHYQSATGLEAIQVVEAFELNFHLGNVVKYVLRAPNKGGVEDLEKARWYLEREIERLTPRKPKRKGGKRA
jgi:hypothetical protein